MNMIEMISRDSFGRYSIERSMRQSLMDRKSIPKDEHYNFKSPVEYWLVVIGLAIGYGSFWRFPYLVYSCG